MQRAPPARSASFIKLWRQAATCRPEKHEDDRRRCRRHLHRYRVLRFGHRPGRHPQNLDHARRSLPRHRSGDRRNLPRQRRRSGRHRLRAARHHHGDERGAGAQGRACGHADQRRLPRHHPHRTASARRALLDHARIAVAEPAAGQAASPQGRQGQACAAARRGARAARRGGRDRGGAGVEGGSGRGRRGLLFVFLSQSGA